MPDPILNQDDDQLEALQKAHRDLAVLYEVSNAMRTTLELNHVLYIILTCVTAHTGLGFNRAILFLTNEKDRCLEPKIAIGPESGEHAQKIWDYIEKSNAHIYDLIDKNKFSQNGKASSLLKAVSHLKISLSAQEKSLLGWAYKQGEPVHIKADKIHEYFNDPLLQTFKTTELVIMPLKARDKVKGMIIADNLFTQKPITEDDLRMFIMLSNQAGLAIENSELYERIMLKSRMDSITNLWNHGYFQDQLSREIDYTKAMSQPLTLLMIDIDNFKSLNDTFGHQSGDVILKEIAQIIKDSSREMDYVCRYGGEEFSIILTQAGKDLGYQIAERIRQGIESHPFPKFTSTENLRVTFSVGMANFPLDANSKEELIAQADKAMYVAKFSGRNRTCVANS